MAAADAVQYVGMPEGRIPLAEAVVYLATAPKSNALIPGARCGHRGRARGQDRSRTAALRDAHYAGAKKLGHGKGYQYSHDSELGVVEQQYLPDELLGVNYYQPTEHGNERDVSARWEKLRRIIRGK